MKKYFLPCLLTLLVGAVGGLLYNFFAFGGTGILPQRPPATVVPAIILSPSPATTELESVGRAALLAHGERVLEAIKTGDYALLASEVHPERGLTFTPFSTVERENVTLTAEELAAAGEKDRKYVWGADHGKGDKIELSVKEYMARYVADTDYAASPIIGVNHVSASGNALENVAEAYPDDDFLEYYVPGVDLKNGGLDWRALKLVFGTYQGRLKLVAVIHSEWTI